MEQTKTSKILENWPQENLDELVRALNTNYIVSDEDEKKLSSAMIEHWSKECDDYLRKNGYNGGKLAINGRYFPDHGAVYAIYDETEISYDQAREYLCHVAKRDD